MQLITAIQIRRKLFPEAEADLILSDHSVNAENTAVRLEKANIFDRVKHSKDRYFSFEQSNLQDFLDIGRLAFGVGNKYKSLFFEDCFAYDRIFYYNFSFIIFSALDLSTKHGHIPVLCRMEEGIHSYPWMTVPELDCMGLRLHMIYRVRRLIQKACIFESTNAFYVFFEGLFQNTDRAVHGIPKPAREDGELVRILNKCFDYHPERDAYPEKYIFFGSSRELDGFESGETRAVLELAERVGKDNLLVKMHPRDGRSIYGDYGIRVSKKSYVPWEVIQMNHDFSRHVFITMSSGSVINGCALFGDQIPTYLLYPMDAGRDTAYNLLCRESLGETITKLQGQGLCLKHKIVNGIGAVVGIDCKPNGGE